MIPAVLKYLNQTYQPHNFLWTVKGLDKLKTSPNNSKPLVLQNVAWLLYVQKCNQEKLSLYNHCFLCCIDSQMSTEKNTLKKKDLFLYKGNFIPRLCTLASHLPFCGLLYTLFV